MDVGRLLEHILAIALEFLFEGGREQRVDAELHGITEKRVAHGAGEPANDLLGEAVGKVLAFEIAHLSSIAADNHREVEHGIVVGEHELGNLRALSIGDNQFQVVAELMDHTALSGLAETGLPHLSDAVERAARDASLGLDAHLLGRYVFYLQAIAIAPEVDDELGAVVAEHAVAVVVVQRTA